MGFPVTPAEYRRDRRNLIRECALIESLGSKCYMSKSKTAASGFKRVSLDELFVFSLFGLEYLRTDGVET